MTVHDPLVDKQQRPRGLACRWPAEWEPHQATWLAWPHNRETWPGIFEGIPPVFCRLATLIAEFEPVHVLAGPPVELDHVRRALAELSPTPRHSIELHPIPTNDAWIRDHGPMFLNGTDGQLMVDWQYNAWGGKYPPFDRDNAVPARISELLGYRRFCPGMVLEGGAVDGNGRGLLLTTESCLLSAGRNPTMERSHIEQYLRDYACSETILWLPGNGLPGDDTDGHVDQLARFVDPTTVVVATALGSQRSDYPRINDNLRRIEGLAVELDSPLEVVRLPLPAPVFHREHRLPASYCNFYLLNGAAIVPCFGDPADAEALRILEALLPQRRVIDFDARELALGLGTIHCLTQQQPVPPEPT